MVPRDSGDDIKRGRDAVATAEGGTRAKQWRRTGQPLCRTPKSRSPAQHVCGQGRCSAPLRESFLAHRYRCEVAGLLPRNLSRSRLRIPKKSLFSERLSERPTSACFGTCGKNVSSVPVSTCNHDLVRSDMHLSQHNAKRWRATAAYVRRANRPRRSYSSPRGVVSGCLLCLTAAVRPRAPLTLGDPHPLTHQRDSPYGCVFGASLRTSRNNARRLGISGPDSKHVGLGSREGHGRCAPQHAPREPLAQPRLVGMGILPRGAGQVHARLRRGAEQRR